jgi:anti-sigma-K factor RskA
MRWRILSELKDWGEIMNSVDHESETRDCGVDVAAYALGALDQKEAEAFRAHLESCVVCRDELTAFEEVVAVLPTAVPPQPAPGELRERVFEAVANEPRTELTGPERRRARPRRPRLSIPRPALALAAAAVLAAVALIGVELGSSGSGAKVFAAQVTGPGRAELTVSGGRGELIVRGFSPPPAGQVYEVWLARPGRAPAPTRALFSVTTRGDADVGVPGSLAGVRTVMVTPEPAGGTLHPTHPPVISAQLS